jgi:hypothetical protein
VIRWTCVAKSSDETTKWGQIIFGFPHTTLDLADVFPAVATLTSQVDAAQTHRFPEFLQAPWQPVRDIWALF